MIIGDLTTDFEDAEFPELWPTFGFNPNATGPTGNTVYGIGRGPQINGTLTNMDPATDWVRTEKGLALDFDGSNDFISIVNAGLAGLTTYTIVCFIRPSTITTDSYVSDFSPGNRVTILSGFQDGYYNIFGAGYATGDPVGTQMPITAAGALDCVVYQRIGSTMNGFLNGRQRMSVTITNGFFTPQAGMIIGRPYHADSGYFNGRIYDYRNYSRALNPAEIALDYSLGPGGWARRKSPASVYVPSGQAFIDHTSTILRLMSGGVL